MAPDPVDAFEEHRAMLRVDALRLLGSVAAADDALQETWLRYHRADTSEVDNLAAWLRTVLARVCLDHLRADRVRRAASLGPDDDQVAEPASPGRDPADEAVLTDAAGRALLVVLDRLEPNERVALVLHDSFGLRFAEIGRLLDLSPGAAKKAASRGRGKLRGTSEPDPEISGRWAVVERFLDAARQGDVPAMLDVLAPDVVRRADVAAIGPDRPAEVRGVDRVAEELGTFVGVALFAAPVLVDGVPGLVIAPWGRLQRAVRIEVIDDRISAYELIGEPERLAALRIELPA